jgi:phage gp45-like
MSRSPKIAPALPTVIPLRAGRELAVLDGGGDQVVEIRSAEGDLELRIELTESGPVLRLEAVKLALRAADAVEIECARFAVNASEGARVASGGDLEIEAEGESRMTSTGDTRITGKLIYLN